MACVGGERALFITPERALAQGVEGKEGGRCRQEQQTKEVGGIEPAHVLRGAG